MMATRCFFEIRPCNTKGACYKAANWVHVGQTTGRGKKSCVHHQIIPIKDIWLYPLRKDFAAVLCQ